MQWACHAGLADAMIGAVRCYRYALICVLAACRLEFDALPHDAAPDALDALTGHDEDGDGLPDAVDPCPHIAGDASDSDDDRVGDACDPRPSTPGDAYVAFATMQAGDTLFDAVANATQEADSLRYIGDHALTRTLAIGTLRIELGWEILGLEANPQHQIAVGVEGSDPYYFAELNDNQGTNNLAVVSYDMTNGYVTRAMDPHNGVHPGVGVFRLDVRAGTQPQFHVQAGWVGELYEALGDTPGYASGTMLRFVFNGLDVRIRYAVLISSP